jgi:hypothetical protein
MKFFITGIFFMAFVSCKTKPGKQQVSPTDTGLHIFPASYKTPQTLKSPVTLDTSGTNEQADAFADYYILVADTGSDYYSLRNKMIDLEHSAGIPIDTSGRYYNKSKDLIMEPDTTNGENYGDDYYPRRYPSKNLSLEYMNFYKPSSKKKTLGLIAGIYETQAAVDSTLQSISLPKSSFAFKSKVYIGCMH